MADEIDIANDLIDNELSRALNKLRQNASYRSTGREFCLECGDTMPQVRRNLGFQRCVPCAEEAERREQMYADH
jgi:RNA polymerase-binding transcription factor DksA